MTLARFGPAFIAFLVLLMPLETAARTTTIVVRAAQLVEVPRTSVVARVVHVWDFSSQGCEGGPQGCPDRVELAVTNGKSRVMITLFQAHTAYQKAKRIDRKTVFGVEFILVKLNVSTATLRVVGPA